MIPRRTLTARAVALAEPPTDTAQVGLRPASTSTGAVSFDPYGDRLSCRGLSVRCRT
jgi:hypothetical protein